MVLFNVRDDGTIRNEVKIICAENGITMLDFATNAITEAIDAYRQNGRLPSPGRRA